MSISVYPQPGKTYPDANGVPITAAGAVVAESEYIQGALDAGYLLTSDPLSIYEPEDRTSNTGKAPATATYLTLSLSGELSAERVLAGGPGIELTDGGAGGELIISAVGGGSGMAFDNVAALTAAPGAADNQAVTLLGYYSPGDGGGGVFYWDEGSSTTVDNGLVFAATGGRWKRLVDYFTLNVRWFGAKGDGLADDTAAIQAAITAAGLTPISETFDDIINIRVVFPAGFYRITDTVTLPADTLPYAGSITLEGASFSPVDNTASMLVWDSPTATKSMLQVYASGVLLRGLGFAAKTGRTVYSGVDWSKPSSRSSTALKLEHCKFTAINPTFGVGGTMHVGLSVGHLTPSANNLEYLYCFDCAFLTCGRSVYIETTTGQAKRMTFERCQFSNQMYPAPTGIGVEFVSGSGTFKSCTFGYLETAIKGRLVENTYLDDVDSEGCKKFLDVYGSISFNSFVPIVMNSGRLSTGWITMESPNYPASDHDYIILVGASLMMTGVSFQHDVVETPMKIKANTQDRLVSIGCFYPNPDPFVMEAYSSLTSIGNMCIVNSTPPQFILQSMPTIVPATPIISDGSAPWTSQPTRVGALQVSQNNSGVATIADAATSISVVFPSIAEPDTAYKVMTSLQSVSGAPASGSLVAYSTSLTTSGFTIAVPAAPGVGSSVTFNWFLVRN